MVERAIRGAVHHGRRVAIGVAGGTILVAGVAMIVLPGPAIVAIPAGLGILSIEFEWAGRWRDALLARLPIGKRGEAGSAADPDGSPPQIRSAAGSSRSRAHPRSTS
jgi:hypothetical protein